MTKDYYLEGVRYYYCRHYRRWLVDCDDHLEYCTSKKDAEEYIKFMLDIIESR